MKTKMKVIASALMVAGFAAFVLLAPKQKAIAGTPTFSSRGDSQYVVLHSTLSVSSMTATAINGITGYRELTIQFTPNALQDGVSVFYRLDGSTTSIAATGAILRLSTANATGQGAGGNSLPAVNEFSFETSKKMTIQLSSGSALGGPVFGRLTQKILPPQ